MAVARHKNRSTALSALLFDERNFFDELLVSACADFQPHTVSIRTTSVLTDSKWLPAFGLPAVNQRKLIGWMGAEEVTQHQLALGLAVVAGFALKGDVNRSSKETGQFARTAGLDSLSSLRYDLSLLREEQVQAK